MTEKNASSQRLDQLLVARGLFDSRSRARDAIARGTVTVGGSIVTKDIWILGLKTLISL